MYTYTHPPPHTLKIISVVTEMANVVENNNNNNNYYYYYKQNSNNMHNKLIWSLLLVAQSVHHGEEVVEDFNRSRP